METIRLNIRLDKGHFLRAARRRYWRSLGWMVGIAPLFAILPFWRAAALQEEVAQKNMGAVMLAAGLLVAIALFLAFAVETCARMFAQHAARQTPLGLESQTVMFSQEGMEAETARSAGSIKWSAFRKAILTSWSFQLHFGTAQYVLLPFDQFPSRESRNELRQMLKQHLGERAKFQA